MAIPMGAAKRTDPLFSFIFSVVFSHYLDGSGFELPWPVVGNFHALCPFGAVESAEAESEFCTVRTLMLVHVGE